MPMRVCGLVMTALPGSAICLTVAREAEVRAIARGGSNCDRNLMAEAENGTPPK